MDGMVLHFLWSYILYLFVVFDREVFRSYCASARAPINPIKGVVPTFVPNFETICLDVDFAACRDSFPYRGRPRSVLTSTRQAFFLLRFENQKAEFPVFMDGR